MASVHLGVTVDAEHQQDIAMWVGLWLGNAGSVFNVECRTKDKESERLHYPFGRAERQAKSPPLSAG
jgi:hypothetical protein